EEEGEEEENEESEKKRSKEASEMGSNSEPSGYAAIDNDVESDLESTARSEPNGPSNEENPNIAAIIAQQLQTILPQIVTQVTNNVNNGNANSGNGGNSGNDGNNGCSYKTLLACNPRDYDGKGGASAILKAGILTDEAVHCGTLSRSSEKRKEVEETSKQGGSWKDNKKATVGKGFVATAPPRNENVGSYSKCAKCFAYHPEGGPCKLCFNCQKPGHFARDYRAPVKQVEPVSAVRMGNNQRVCYECGSSEYLCNTCPKLNRAPGQAGNRLALEGYRNTQNTRNQARGRAFSVNTVDALQDPNVVT
ncbi:reverse transcriptase domain-containing protein, partial [Tanacetum coccineum]